MSEKVIGEIRFIETEDGFRVEVKGDKEQLKKMGWKPGAGPGFMGMGGHHKRAWHGMWPGFGRHHGPRSHFGRGPGFARGRGGPCFWWYWDAGETEDEEDYEKKPKDF
jgi:hypothetical protein